MFFFSRFTFLQYSCLAKCYHTFFILFETCLVLRDTDVTKQKKQQHVVCKPFRTRPSFTHIYIYLKYIFEVKLTFEMLTVHGQQHSFSTHERVFLWKCQRFWDRKWFDLRRTRTPNLRIHAECSNLLSYQGQTFVVPPCFSIYIYIYITHIFTLWSNCKLWYT